MTGSDEDYADTGERTFRSLILALLDAEKGQKPSRLPNGLLAGLTHANQMLEAAADSLLKRFSAIPNANDRGDAFGDAEMLIEAALRIALHDSGRAGQVIDARKKGGRRPSTETGTVRDLVFELMDYNGEFLIGDLQWNAQARLEEAVGKRLNSDLSESRLRELIVPHLAEWRSQKAT